MPSKPIAKKSAAKPAAKYSGKVIAKPAAKVAVKPAAKFAAKPAVKKAAAKHSSGAAVKGGFGPKEPPEIGYKVASSGLLVPEKLPPGQGLVPSSKLVKGMKDAQAEISKAISAISDAFTGDFDVAEIEVSASFDIKGAFLGFGIGGATSIKIKMKPKTI